MTEEENQPKEDILGYLFIGIPIFLGFIAGDICTEENETISRIAISGLFSGIGFMFGMSTYEKIKEKSTITKLGYLIGIIVIMLLIANILSFSLKFFFG